MTPAVSFVDVPSRYKKQSFLCTTVASYSSHPSGFHIKSEVIAAAELL